MGTANSKLIENMVWKLYVIVSDCARVKFFVFSYSYSQDYLKMTMTSFVAVVTPYLSYLPFLMISPVRGATSDIM